MSESVPTDLQSRVKDEHLADKEEQKEIDLKEFPATASGVIDAYPGLNSQDLQNVFLLVILYLLQGIPVGLAFGSIPFLLKSKLSYSQLGIFSLATYPYSLKLLWSPIVDATYSKRVGRRKSWIIPIQLLTGSLFFWLGNHIDQILEDSSYSDDEMDISTVYKTIWNICKMPHLRKFIVVLLVAKIGFIANEAVTGLKLLEKGFSKEDLALAVLIDFPFQILFGYYAAKWSNGSEPLKPWIYAFYGRLFFAVVGMLVVLTFPTDNEISLGFFFFVILSTVMSSFMSTVQFVSISAFMALIADPMIGGTYMTLLATFSNLGGTWPRFFVLEAVDYFTEAVCYNESNPEDLVNCITDEEKANCKSNGGTCIVNQDGYFFVSNSSNEIDELALYKCRKLSAFVKELDVLDLFQRKLSPIEKTFSESFLEITPLWQQITVDSHLKNHIRFKSYQTLRAQSVVNTNLSKLDVSTVVKYIDSLAEIVCKIIKDTLPEKIGIMFDRWTNNGIHFVWLF
ncbi:682_t:CDS:10, partial [Gigaspora margarita]